jgi:hypothetical protein
MTDETPTDRVADRGDAVVVTWRPAGFEDPHRVVFEPNGGHDSPAWERHEQVRDGDGWRTIGSEFVETLTVEERTGDE